MARATVRRSGPNSQKLRLSGKEEDRRSLFERRGGKFTNKWEEVVAILESSFLEVQQEALKLKPLLEKDLANELVKGNVFVLSCAVNRIHRIRRGVDINLVPRVIDDDSLTIEQALRLMLLYKWDGSIVRFSDPKKQNGIIRNKKAFFIFVVNNGEWVDPNTQVLALVQDVESLRMTVNQIHFNSLQGKCDMEYENVWGRSLMLKPSCNLSLKTRNMANSVEEEGQKIYGVFFKKRGEMLNVILPKNSDKYNNRICFVKTASKKIARNIIIKLKGKPLLRVTLDILLENDQPSQNNLSKSRRTTGTTLKLGNSDIWSVPKASIGNTPIEPLVCKNSKNTGSDKEVHMNSVDKSHPDYVEV